MKNLELDDFLTLFTYCYSGARIEYIKFFWILNAERISLHMYIFKAFPTVGKLPKVSPFPIFQFCANLFND